MTDENKTIAQSSNPADERREQLAALVPEAFAEGRLDVAALKRALGEDALIEGGERYALNWAGKSAAYKVLQTPSTATLRPERDKSVNMDVPRKRGESDEAYNARRADVLQRERQALTRQLVFLNDLAYIIECVALTYTGEAKSEISALSRKLEDIENPAEAERYEEAYLKLDEAWSCLSSGDGHRAAGILSSISRSLWKRILPPC